MAKTYKKKHCTFLTSHLIFFSSRLNYIKTYFVIEKRPKRQQKNTLTVCLKEQFLGSGPRGQNADPQEAQINFLLYSKYLNKTILSIPKVKI